MTKQKDRLRGGAASRRRVKGRARNAPQPEGSRERRLVHELAVYRIELDAQNEELRSARAQAEQVAARLMELFDHSPLGHVTLDGLGVILAVNFAAARLLGRVPESLVGRRLEPFVVASDRNALDDLLAAARDRREEGGLALEVALASPDDAIPPEVPVHVRLTARSMPTTHEILVCLEDISARRKADELLREADRRKGEFLAMLGHELRTPLSAIVTAAHILEHELGGDAGKRAQRIVRRQAEHIARLVDDLLDVSRIERGKLALKRSRVDLREIILRVAEDFRPTLEDHGVRFRLAVPDAGVWADVDGTRITQVVGNLLANAAKFTRRDDEVLLSLVTVGALAEIRVKDSGAGIDPAVLPHIFGAFVQGERTAARSASGLGVGLAVVKALTELHGGTVRAESEGAGRGAEVVVRLPLEAPATTPAP